MKRNLHPPPWAGKNLFRKFSSNDERDDWTRAKIKDYRSGDHDAGNEVVVCYMPMALRLAKRFLYPKGLTGHASEDAVSDVASLAIVKAIWNFDPDRGRFHTCLWWEVRSRSQKWIAAAEAECRSGPEVAIPDHLEKAAVATSPEAGIDLPTLVQAARDAASNPIQRCWLERIIETGISDPAGVASQLGVPGTNVNGRIRAMRDRFAPVAIGLGYDVRVPGRRKENVRE